VCFKKITKPPVLGGQGPYKDCRATDDDDDDDDEINNFTSGIRLP